MQEVQAYSDNELFDKLEKAIIMSIEDSAGEVRFVKCPLVHRFTKDMYSREITMPGGTCVISERHVTENQFILSQGIVSFWTEEDGEVTICAPFHGITKPGTKRALYIRPEGGDAIWTTFHSTLHTTVEEVYNSLVEHYSNPYLQGKYRDNRFVPDELLLEKELNN